MSEPAKRACGSGEDYPLNKRIKQEPVDQELEDSDEYLYGDQDVDPSSAMEDRPIFSSDNLFAYGLSSDIEDCMLRLFELNPNPRIRENLMTSAAEIESEYSKKLMNVSGRKSFDNYNHYVVTFLPYVMSQMFEKVLELSSQQNPPRKFFILLKTSEKYLEFRCVSLRPAIEEPNLQAGDLVIVKSVFKAAEDKISSSKNFCGFVLHSLTRAIDFRNQIEVSLIERVHSNERHRYLVDEIVLRMKHIEEFHTRNDYYLSISSLGSLSTFVLQVKAVTSINQSPSFLDILDFKGSIKPSSLSIEPETNLTSDQLDTVQKAIDLVGQNDQSSSKFFIINVESPPLRHKFRLEIIRQLYKCAEFLVSTSVDPNLKERVFVLVLSENVPMLETIYLELDTDERFKDKVAFLGSRREDEKITNACINRYQQNIKELEDSMVNLRPDDLKERAASVETVKACIEFLRKRRSADQLDARKVAEISSKKSRYKRTFIENSFVIMSTFEQLAKDIDFYHVFNPGTVSKNRIICAIVDDACSYTEPQLFVLITFGVHKFILIGYSNGEEKMTDQATILGLSRPLFIRFLKNKELEFSLHSSLVHHK